MSKILTYKTPTETIELTVTNQDGTIWFSLGQIASLLQTNESYVLEHISDIANSEAFPSERSCPIRACSEDPKNEEFYSLETVLALAYRIPTASGRSFRQWVASSLMSHWGLAHGLSTDPSSLKRRSGKTEERRPFKKIIKDHGDAGELNLAVLELILSYAKTWNLLLAYDEDHLGRPLLGPRQSSFILTYKDAKSSIEFLKLDLRSRNEASDLFGHERDKGLESILQNIEQTFQGNFLYPTLEEKAAHLLYFVIKDHPFSDGNKRIGCFLFLLYLNLQKAPARLNENGLLALALLIAQSDPKQKETMINLIVNILADYSS